MWHPGWTHGTEAIDGPSLALSKQFAAPASDALTVHRHRDLFERHSERYGSFGHCGWFE